MGAPKLSNSRVLLETGANTKVICVTWELADSSDKPDGEWTVEWEDMYSDLSEDVRSAQSESGGYFALQREIDTVRTPKAQTAVDPIPPYNFDEPLPTGPLSTARLLEFENGLNFPDVQEDLPSFFSSRPIVQAPTQILSDPHSVSKKTEVLFLLSPATPIPQSIKIFFTPTWSPPNMPPAMLAEIRIMSYAAAEGLHTAWATKRLEDLQALQEIARELEREGSRGVGQGRLKVGVEGGGMDEEAVRREGWMVGEEQVWVVEKFLTCSVDEKTVPCNSVMDPFAGLGISTGMHLGKTSEVLERPAAEAEEEEEEDLFALPLSPRSPDMTMSPFSMFRGEALGKGPTPRGSSFRNIESIDTYVGLGLTTDLAPINGPASDVTPTNKTASTTIALAPPTPPRES